MKKINPENNIVKAIHERFNLNFISSICDGQYLIMQTRSMNRQEASNFKNHLSSFFSDYNNVSVNLRDKKCCDNSAYINVSVVFS